MEELISKEEYNRMEDMILDVEGDNADESVDKIKKHFGIWTLAQLTSMQAEVVFDRLEEKFAESAEEAFKELI